MPANPQPRKAWLGRRILTAASMLIESRGAVALVLSAYVLSLWAFGALVHGSGDLHHDMLEAWAWGKEFQLGYFKHPPVFAWVTGLWFQVFPRTASSFMLLSAVNAGIGAAGVWMISGLLLATERQRMTALLIYLVIPFSTFHAIKFNANAILLSLWPWTAYFFIRSLQSRRLGDGLLFGVMAAIAMCGKYYSALLLASCLLASFVHRDRWAYYRSLAPYATLAGFLVAMTPHAAWVIANGLPTVDYALTKTTAPVGEVLLRGARAQLETAAFLLVPVSIIALAWRGRLTMLASRLGAGLRTGENAWLILLTLGPLLLTLLACVAGNVRISAQFMMPTLYLVPIAFLAVGRIPVPHLRLTPLAWSALTLMLASLLVASLVRVGALTENTDAAREPRKEVAAEATRLWRETFGAPLKIVSGTVRYAQAATFYSPDAPSDFTDFDRRKAPWVTAERLEHTGLLVICESADAHCASLARRIPLALARREERVFEKASTRRTIVFHLFAPALGD